MPLKVIHVSDLKGLSFNIPSYQRGYRWEKKHVTALLDDLLEFNGSGDPFYCLQPLVVVKNEDLSTPDKVVYDVVDGQQRLTTIFLIRNFFEINKLLKYHLRYERLVEGDSSNYDDGRVLSFEKLKSLTDEDKKSNADFFYMGRALENIESWFERKAEKIASPKSIIQDVLYPSTYKMKSDYINGGEDINSVLKDARFIWYEADGEEMKNAGINVSPIATFRRLNHGKTSLTAAELIKSLLFQCDLYGDRKEVQKEIAFRRSTEWNDMEIRLQNPYFWGMIGPDEYERPSHIDLILSFVANDLMAKVPADNILSNKADQYYDYFVFDSYLNLEKGEVEQEEFPDEYASRVEEVWQKVQDVYAIFLSWFEDREMYHRIGLLFALKKSKGEQRLADLKELKEKYERCTRDAFLNYVREKIADQIRLSKDERLDNIDYEHNWKDIVNILLVYNVEATLANSAESHMFPFDFYKGMTPSLEHIHPQHLDNGDIKFEDLCQWYVDKRDALKSSRSAAELAVLKSDFDLLDRYLTLESGEKEFKSSPACQASIQNIDKYFDTLAGIDAAKLHTIDNMALIDKETNSSLGNKLLDKKREKLLERARLYEETEKKPKREGAYIMRGTWQVFNKEFNNDVKELKFWTKADRTAYYTSIEKVYNGYTAVKEGEKKTTL